MASMQLHTTFDWQTTPPMQAIAVLADDSFQQPFLDQFDKHHMCGCGNSLRSAQGSDAGTPRLSMSL